MSLQIRQSQYALPRERWVIASDAALADAAATGAANLVSSVEDVDLALERTVAIEGVDGVIIVQADRIGLAGRIPPLVKIQS